MTNLQACAKSFHTPAYRRQHKKSGADLAFVRLDGKRIYLGPFESPQSRARYHELVGQWEMSGRLLPTPPERISVAEIARQYLSWANGYYVKDGQPTAEPGNIILAVRPLLALFEGSPAAQFGPKSLKIVRQRMIDAGWVRKHINKQAGRIKRMFKWAVAEELLPPSTYEGLRALSGLRFGRCGARDNPPVGPVPDNLIEPVKRHVSKQVAAMIELQLLTGARPGEIVIMQRGDIDQSDSVWVYHPSRFKTQHHGHTRDIFIGPKAQEVLMPFLVRRMDEYCFSPREAEKERYDLRHEQRVTPAPCGNKVRKENPKDWTRTVGEHYTATSYCRVIARAIMKAFPMPESLPRQKRHETQEAWLERLTDQQRQDYSTWRKTYWWHPHQLRHNTGTKARQAEGLESAQVLLGHSKADVTQIYAERDMARAMRLAMKIG